MLIFPLVPAMPLPLSMLIDPPVKLMPEPACSTTLPAALSLLPALK
jgi:hypothetical protein